MRDNRIIIDEKTLMWFDLNTYEKEKILLGKRGMTNYQGFPEVH